MTIKKLIKGFIRGDRAQYKYSLILYGGSAFLTLSLVLATGRLSLEAVTSLFAGGLLSWTLVEYILHRFPFHSETLLSKQHLFHHEFPNHPDYVNAPLLLSLPMYLLILGILWGIFWTASHSLGGGLMHASLMMGGLSVGFLVYEWIHYSVHHCPARTGLGRYWKRYHLIHHFKDSDNYFGVTSPFWDILFGTKPDYDPQKEAHVLPIFRLAPAKPDASALHRGENPLSPRYPPSNHREHPVTSLKIAELRSENLMGRVLAWESLLRS